MELGSINRKLQMAADALPPIENTPESEFEETEVEVNASEPQDESITEKYRSHTDQEKRDRNTTRMRESYEERIKALEEEKKSLAKAAKAARKGLEDDDYVEGRHYNEMLDEIRELKENMAQQAAALAHEQQLAHLKTRFSDFDEVVNERTLKRLQKEDPDAFAAINNARDLKSGGAAFYRIIKGLGLEDDVSEDNARRIETNMKKPGVARNPSPLSKMESFSNPNSFSHEDRIAHNKLVEHYARGGS